MVKKKVDKAEKEGMGVRHVGIFFEEFQSRLDMVLEAVTSLRTEIKNEIAEFRAEVNERFCLVEAAIKRLDVRVSRVEARLDRVEARLDRVEARLDSIDKHLALHDCEINCLKVKVS